MVPRCVLIAATLVALPFPARADAPMRVTTAVSTAHGRGLGAGVELGVDTTLVVGVGAAMQGGYSSLGGWIGTVDPGIGIGLRQYASGWYLGPTIGANQRVAERGSFEPVGTRHYWGAVEVGHRWMRSSGHAFKLGIAVGGLRTELRGDTQRFITGALEWSWEL